jgi:TonB family protein
VVVPQSKPLRSGKIIGASDRDSLEENSWSQPSNFSGDLDESTALSSLKELIAAGNHRLDPILGTIADAARQLTGASGAALAMWKDGAMVCRARSGDTAPVLGARLSADRGISGACLRTGKIQHCVDSEMDPLVDVEVCRSLGVRSILVLPIQGWRGINGILEVFSTQPVAFSEPHISFLQQLAELAERARAAQPHGASSTAPKLPAMESPQPSGLLPASDRVGDMVLASMGTRSRPLVLSAAGVGAVSLLALVIWLGWRGPGETDAKARVATPAVVDGATANAARAHAPEQDDLDKHALDNDRVWKTNPGGESLVPSSGKPLAGTPVKLASKVDVVAGKKTSASRSQTGRSLLPGDVAANVTILHEIPSAPAGSSPADSTQAGSPMGSQAESRPADSRSDQTTSTDSASIPTGSANPSDLSGVPSAKVSLPGFSAPASPAVSGGQLVHRVAPVYPAQARLLHLEGKVILAATVMEDGTVRDVKVVEGSPALAEAAVDAVKRWRYKPFELEGKPVKNEIGINVEFKLPESLNH